MQLVVVALSYGVSLSVGSFALLSESYEHATNQQRNRSSEADLLSGASAYGLGVRLTTSTVALVVTFP